MARPLAELVLTDDERRKLTTWASRAKSTQRLATWAKIVLACAEVLEDRHVAARLRVRSATVGTWRRFVERRLEGLADEPRPGAPRKITDADAERVVTRTLETKPRDATHRGTRGMAVGRRHVPDGRRPHPALVRAEAAPPRDVQALDRPVLRREGPRRGRPMSPPERAIVPCVDEESQVQALDRTQPLLPMTPGQAGRQAHDYVRHGTASLFAALNVATGEVIGKCHRRHRAEEFLRSLDEVHGRVPHEEGVEVRPVQDKYATHKTPAVNRWSLRHPEYRLHSTPTSSSWLNQVERFFARLTKRSIRRGVAAPAAAIKEYLEHHNAAPRPFVWTADADLILDRSRTHAIETAKNKAFRYQNGLGIM